MQKLVGCKQLGEEILKSVESNVHAGAATVWSRDQLAIELWILVFILEITMTAKAEKISLIWLPSASCILSRVSTTMHIWYMNVTLCLEVWSNNETSLIKIVLQRRNILMPDVLNYPSEIERNTSYTLLTLFFFFYDLAIIY